MSRAIKVNRLRRITSLIAIMIGALCMVQAASFPGVRWKQRKDDTTKEGRHFRNRKSRRYEAQTGGTSAGSTTGQQSQGQQSQNATSQMQKQKHKVEDKPTYTAELQQKAEVGDVTAQLNLALCYDTGSGIEKNPVEAHKWFLKAAEQGNGRALNAVGMNYANGTGGVEKDLTEAIKWYRKSAEQGNDRGQCSMGWCYEYGKGVEKDLAEAVKWYRKSAEQGNAFGQNSLGRCYEYGKGVEKDMAEAVKWYRKSAEQGNVLAQNNLALCYAFGTGVGKDRAEAAKWLRKSAEQGNAYAQHKLGLVYQNGDDGVKKDVAEAIKWQRKSAEQGYASAQSTLGSYYFNGFGVRQDFSEAIKWFRKSAEQGNPDGQNRLGAAYSSGKGVEKDLLEAVKWFRKSAEQGDDVGQLMLGIYYFEGKGVKEDVEEAFKWLSKSAKQGNEDAKGILKKPEFSVVRVVRGNADDIEAGEACLQKLKEFKKDGRFSVETPAPRENGVLVVKGLYIGMPVDDAVVACGKIAASSDNYVVVDSRMLKDEKWSQYNYLKDKMKGCDGVCVFSCKDSKNIQDAKRLCVARLDRDGSVRQIFFTQMGMDELFKARNMSTEEFAKALVDNYQQIPSLNKSVKSKRENGADICEYRWTCNARGCNVELYENTLIVQGREINLREYKSIMANDPNALGVAFGESLFNKYLCIDGNTKKVSGAFD